MKCFAVNFGVDRVDAVRIHRLASLIPCEVQVLIRGAWIPLAEGADEEELMAFYDSVCHTVELAQGDANFYGTGDFYVAKKPEVANG